MRVIVLMVVVAMLVGCTPIQNVQASNYSLAYQAASKFLGEAEYSERSFFLLSCTVKNRLEKGWNPALVLSHYYGYPQAPTSDMVKQVQDVLDGASCPPVYFAFGKGDLINANVLPIAEYDGVRYYSYEQYKILVNHFGT